MEEYNKNNNVVSEHTLEEIDTHNIATFKQSLALSLIGDNCSESVIHEFCEKIYAMLDKYNIEHSRGYIVFDPYFYESEEPIYSSDMKAEPHSNFAYIINKDKSYSNYIDFALDHEMMIYTNEPRFSDIQTMLDFICDLITIESENLELGIDRLMFCNKVNKFYIDDPEKTNSIFIDLEEVNLITFCMGMNSSDWYNKQSFQPLNDLIKWFFGQKTAKQFKTHLKKTREFCYSAVPDDIPFFKKKN